MTLKLDQHGQLVQASRPALSQTLSIGGSTLQSAAFSTGQVAPPYNPDGTPANIPNNTTHIRVVATSACWIAFGSNPVAAASSPTSIYLPAFTPEYFWVNKGERVAVIQDSGAGILNIGELVQ